MDATFEVVPILMYSMKLSLRKRIVFSLTFIILIFLTFEVIIRIFHLAPLHVVNQSLYEEVLGDYKPNQDLVDDLIPDLPYHVHINSQGLRGKEISVQKAPGVYRILCLGDSSTFGWGVNDEETYPAQLETLLNEELPDRKFEVLNAGATAYSSRDYLDYLKKKGLRADPDLVIVGFFPNDIADLAKPTSGREQRSRYGRNYEPWKSLINSWAFFNFFRGEFAKVFTRFTRRRGNLKPGENTYAPTSSETVKNLWTQHQEHIREIHSILQQEHIQFLFIAFPESAQVTGENTSTKFQDTLKQFSQEEGMAFIDLLPYFQQDRFPDLLFIKKGDSHPNARGCEIIAHTIYTRLLSEGVLTIDD